MSNQDGKPGNWMAELARKKAEQAAGNGFGVLGEKLRKRPSKKIANRSYTWRGGRNGQGKP